MLKNLELNPSPLMEIRATQLQLEGMVSMFNSNTMLLCLERRRGCYSRTEPLAALTDAERSKASAVLTTVLFGGVVQVVDVEDREPISPAEAAALDLLAAMLGQSPCPHDLHCQLEYRRTRRILVETIAAELGWRLLS